MSRSKKKHRDGPSGAQRRRQTWVDPLPLYLTPEDEDAAVEAAAMALAVAHARHQHIPPDEHRRFYAGIPLWRRDEVTARSKVLKKEILREEDGVAPRRGDEWRK